MALPILNPMFLHVPQAAPGSGSDPVPQYGVLAIKRAAFIEISPASEIDSCVVECPSGRFVITLGCPLSVPTEGPYTFRPVRPMPFSNGAPAFVQMAAKDAPQLALNVYQDCAPSMPVERRGPGYRRSGTITTNTSATAFATVFEFPWYGRHLATVQVQWEGAAGTATVRARGNFYDAPLVGVGGGAGSQGGIAGGTGNTVRQSPALWIVTDTGLVQELAIDSSENISFTIQGEEFDTISIEAHGDGAARSIAIYVKAKDDL